jgi:ABC-2 type transport system permease protein
MSTHTQAAEISGITKFFIDLKFLWLEQMLEVRRTWYWFVVFSLVLPITMVFGFARIGSGLTDYDSLLYIISGSAIFSVTNEGLYTLAVRIGTMKKEGTLVYYASLPISKTAFLIAILLSRMVITFPGMIAPVVIGTWLYDVSFEWSLWILILLPLAALSLSNIGMALGVFVSNLELVQIIVNLLLFVLVLAGPIFSPLEALPLPFQVLSYFLPPTYAAAAFRAALSSSIDLHFYLNLLVLIVMTIAGFTLSTRLMRWRVR